LFPLITWVFSLNAIFAAYCGFLFLFLCDGIMQLLKHLQLMQFTCCAVAAQFITSAFALFEIDFEQITE